MMSLHLLVGASVVGHWRLRLCVLSGSIGSAVAAMGGLVLQNLIC